MRYSKDEDNILVSILPTGLDITIKVIDLKTDTEIELSNNECKESTVLPGIYLWDKNNIVDEQMSEEFYNLFYRMETPDGKYFYGKFLSGGYVDKDVNINLQPLRDDHDALMAILEIINARM